MRAAATGALDFSQADPKDIKWRIRQRLVIREIARQEDLRLYDARHRQWLAYVSHGNLRDESYTEVKKFADAALSDIQRTIYPWVKPAVTAAENTGQKDTIDAETRALIERYKQQQAAARETP